MNTFADSQTLVIQEPVEKFESLAATEELSIPSAEELRRERMVEPNRDRELIVGTQTLHENGTFGVNGAASRSSVGRPERVLTLPPLYHRGDYFNAMQKWEGFVISVENDVFTARLSPIEGKGPEQEAEIREQLIHITPNVVTVSASPYAGDTGIRVAAEQLNRHDPDLVVLHCMGFNREHRRIFRKITGMPVIVANSMVARTVAELLEA